MRSATASRRRRATARTSLRCGSRGSASRYGPRANRRSPSARHHARPAIVGASMGGMQALQWAVSHPGFARIVAMTPMARTARWSQLMNELSRRALFADAGGRGRGRARERCACGSRSRQLVHAARHPEAFSAERRRGERSVEGDRPRRNAEARSRVPTPSTDSCQSRAYDAHDVGATPGFGGDTERALASIEAEVLIAAPASNVYNPPFMARDAARSIRRARFIELPGRRTQTGGVGPVSTQVLRDRIADFLRDDERRAGRRSHAALAANHIIAPLPDRGRARPPSAAARRSRCSRATSRAGSGRAAGRGARTPRACRAGSSGRAPA